MNAEIGDATSDLIQDLILDGYNPLIEVVSKSASVSDVKATIQSHYYKKAIEYIYIIGHIPVPYSGFHAPDGHNDHLVLGHQMAIMET